MMAGLDKRVASYEAALDGLTDGMTLLAGGFGLCGIPGKLNRRGQTPPGTGPDGSF